MALSADAKYMRNGPAAPRNEFGYPPSAGAVIYRNALLAVTAAGTLQPIQTAGSVAFAGIADQASNTPGQPVVVTFLTAQKGTWGIPVPGATMANLNAAVYATDDNTLTLAAGSNLLVGHLAGIDMVTGLTFVELLGS
jgi:hypothetical protein